MPPQNLRNMSAFQVNKSGLYVAYKASCILKRLQKCVEFLFLTNFAVKIDDYQDFISLAVDKHQSSTDRYSHCENLPISKHMTKMKKTGFCGSKIHVKQNSGFCSSRHCRLPKDFFALDSIVTYRSMLRAVLVEIFVFVFSSKKFKVTTDECF